MSLFEQKKQLGFTLIEVVVGIFILGVLLVGVMGSFSALSKATRGARQQTVLTSLSSQYLEIVRNIPYSKVGTINGNPNGTLPDLNNAFTANIEGQQYKIYYEVTYIDDPADGTITAGTDPAPNDYKQVKMFINQTSTNKITDFVTNVSPKGLEGINNAGALSLKVFDQTGIAIPSADIHIQSVGISPAIVLDRQSDSSGNWIEVGLPAGTNAYHITVSKSGYVSDQTYPISGGNPNPTKPDATVSNGQVTQISFSIDLPSSLTIKTQNQSCSDLNGINMNVTGSALIGTTPNVYSYNQNSTSSSGQVALTGLAGDTYTPTLLTGQSYMIYGTSPIQQISVLPDTSQIFTMILGPASTNSLLVIVKDAATGAALEGATVHLHYGGSTPADYYGTTGGNVWQQITWTGGSGQADYTVTNKYFADDGNIDVATSPTGVRLKKSGSKYQLSGNLTSSTFDTTGASNFTTISWNPPSQSAGTTLQFQVATNNDNSTWNYKGPDGTASTYYATPGSSINSIHDNDRYIRYKAFLSTTSNKKTPVLSNITVNYVAGCFSPGQTIFPNLTASSSYTLTVTMPGYQDHIDSNLNINGNQSWEVNLSP